MSANIRCSGVIGAVIIALTACAESKAPAAVPTLGAAPAIDNFGVAVTGPTTAVILVQFEEAINGTITVVNHPEYNSPISTKEAALIQAPLANLPAGTTQIVTITVWRTADIQQANPNYAWKQFATPNVSGAVTPSPFFISPLEFSSVQAFTAVVSFTASDDCTWVIELSSTSATSGYATYATGSMQAGWEPYTLGETDFSDGNLTPDTQYWIRVTASDTAHPDATPAQATGTFTTTADVPSFQSVVMEQIDQTSATVSVVASRGVLFTFALVSDQMVPDSIENPYEVLSTTTDYSNVATYMFANLPVLDYCGGVCRYYYQITIVDQAGNTNVYTGQFDTLTPPPGP